MDTFPDKEYILNVYEHLQYYYQMAMGDGFQCVREFNLEEFCRKFKYFPVPVDSALKILTQAGYLEYTDEQDNASRILFTIRRDELYKLREMGTEAEALIQTILRSYTGVFTDYAYISEATLSIRTGLTREQIYNILVTLTKRRIVDYIPHKRHLILYTPANGRNFVLCIFLLPSTKNAKPGMKPASRRWKSMSLRRMCAGAGCCSVTSERRTSTTADNAMFVLVTVQLVP